jgi:hypothetical protein
MSKKEKIVESKLLSSLPGWSLVSFFSNVDSLYKNIKTDSSKMSEKERKELQEEREILKSALQENLHQDD